MTVPIRLTVVAACGLALALVATVEPALAKDPQPYNAADAARKYCSRAYKRYCSKVRVEGLQAFDCLKQNVKRLPPACREAVQSL
jgi:hypothetical protein